MPAYTTTIGNFRHDCEAPSEHQAARVALGTLLAKNLMAYRTEPVYVAPAGSEDPRSQATYQSTVGQVLGTDTPEELRKLAAPAPTA